MAGKGVSSWYLVGFCAQTLYIGNPVQFRANQCQDLSFMVIPKQMKGISQANLALIDWCVPCLHNSKIDFTDI
jgi:hypothetical protein